ncbi:hypothetical protein [Nitratidesulfovibrio vulgaris]|uniref:hypothetical protein n=1 Tax=Nitratidesulfovibrio vulgaris TaxID=881 RepID=UPI001232BA36|nr:hypothetical protein [Nitratidesulfovibrio vulgaris]
MTITTTLTWTRYDGTDATLPEVNTLIVVQYAEPINTSTLMGIGFYCDDGCVDYAHHGLGRLAEGFLWAPWPEAPEPSSCPCA